MTCFERPPFRGVRPGCTYLAQRTPEMGNPYKKALLGGGFKHFLFSPLFGEMIMLANIFEMG